MPRIAFLLGIPFAALLVAAILLATLSGGSAWGDSVGRERFSISDWEFHSFLNKWTHRLGTMFWSGQPGPTESRKLVEDYFGLAAEANRLRAGMLQAGTQPGGPPGADMEKDYQALVARLDGLNPTVEEILEGQLSAVLAELGLARTVWLGGSTNFLFPPVDFAFATPPNLLIVSPRDRIDLLDTVALRSGLSREQIEAMERQAEAGGNVSALVEPLGGIGSYPSILPSGHSLAWTLETIAHEWLHHYFFLHPLGRSYWASYDMTTINETAASIAGKELGALVYERFYGDEKQQPSASSSEFYEEMRVIRIEVDRLLGKGRVAEAERYMEEERLALLGKGYFIRKLNQAYFAHYGTYADAPTSVSPIGRDLKLLRDQQQSVGEFIQLVATISSPGQLQGLVGAEQAATR